MRAHLTPLGFTFRWLIAGFLVFATWNTGDWSLLGAIFGADGGALSLRVFWFALTAALWAVALRTAHLGLGEDGLRGTLLLMVAVGVVGWNRELVVIDGVDVVVLLAQFGLTTVLATGWCLAMIFHRLTGIGDILANPP